MGRPQRRSRTTVKDKAGTKARRTRRRTKDIDQIQDEISRASKSAPTEQRPIDPEKPGLGQYMCVYCDSYFISDVVMQEHLRSKPHKKRVKAVLSKPYTQRDADAAAGMAAPLL